MASQSRPDLSFEVCHLSNSLNKATIDDLLHANKTVRKCKQRSVCLKFPQLQKPFHLVALCDASYANLKDGSSQGGVIVFLKGKNGKIAPISWSSWKIRRVCRSTLAAETMALLEASWTCCLTSHIINELLKTPLETTEIFTDNKSLYKAAHSTTAVEEKRHCSYLPKYLKKRIHSQMDRDKTPTCRCTDQTRSWCCKTIGDSQFSWMLTAKLL